MRKFFCVTTHKKVLCNEVFLNKEEAYAYFLEKFGTEVMEEWKVKEEKLVRSLAKYEEKLERLEEKDEKLEQLKQKKEAELEKLQEQMSEVKCYYVCKWDCFKEKLEKEAPFLRVCGIYKMPDSQFMVLEEWYYYGSETIEQKTEEQNICECLPKRNYDSMLVFPEEGEKDRAIQFILKARTQILNEHKKSGRWITKM